MYVAIKSIFIWDVVKNRKQVIYIKWLTIRLLDFECQVDCHSPLNVRLLIGSQFSADIISLIRPSLISSRLKPCNEACREGVSSSSNLPMRGSKTQGNILE